MKKLFKKIILPLTMCIIFGLQSVVVFADDNIVDMEEKTEVFNYERLSEILPDISGFENVEVQDSLINYSYEDIEGKIELIQEDEKTLEMKCIEGEKQDIVFYDKVNNKIYVDGEEVIVTERTNIKVNDDVKSDKMNSRSLSFGKKTDEKYREVSLTKKIAGYTKSALTAVLCAALVITNPVAVFFTGVIVNECADAGYADSKAIFCYSYKRVASDYSMYRNYFKMYWDPDYEILCDIYTQDVYA